MDAAPSARDAAARAIAQARAAFGEGTPKLAVVFVSPSYEDAAAVPDVARELLGDVPLAGGTAGGAVIGPGGVSRAAVSVVLIGGDDVSVVLRLARVNPPDLGDVVPAAREVAEAADDAARRGLQHYTCLVFAPAMQLDGETLVAAVRKGAGARAQLAGGLVGDDLTFDRAQVIAGGALRKDRVVLVGVCTRKPIGVAVRHGGRPLGPERVVTRAEGDMLFELDHRPALDVWREDAKLAGTAPPEDLAELRRHLANHHELGIVGNKGQKKGEGGELVVRAPFELFPDGRVRLSGSIGEGLRVEVMQSSRKDLLRASVSAAADAVMRAKGKVAGALLLACSGRLAVLGEEFNEECALIRDRVGAPIGGGCVFGEIARTDRDADAFFNTTAVVVAFPT